MEGAVENWRSARTPAVSGCALAPQYTTVNSSSPKLIRTLLGCLFSHLPPLPGLRFNPPKESAKVQYRASPNGRGTLLTYQLVSRHGSRVTANRSHTASIHILDDYSLLNVFYLYRPAIFNGDDDGVPVARGTRWDRGEWWYKLAHVCRRWRNLTLGSASYLELCLVCAPGKPVADMLAHSPPLPLIIDYDGENDDIDAKDEEGIALALEQRDRVRRIRLWMPLSKLQNLLLFMATVEEYPVLEYMVVGPVAKDDLALILPGTIQAPHLHHLLLSGFTFPTRPRLLTTAMGLVTFHLYIDHRFTDLRLTVLLQCLSSMPQLETLGIAFSHPVPNRDVERQLMHTRITTQVTLPNLRQFLFQGVTAYLEALVRQITAPSLEKLEIMFFEHLTFSVPLLLQFMHTAENLRFGRCKFQFSNDHVVVKIYPRKEAKMCAFSIYIYCWHLDWQVSSVAQISNSLSHIFSAVEHLTLEHGVHSRSSEEHNEIDRTEWRKLLRSFRNVKALYIDHGLADGLSRSLQSDDGKLPLALLPEWHELLPELQEHIFLGRSDVDGILTDGYISYTFTPQMAEFFLVQLLFKVGNTTSIEVIRDPSGSGAYFAFNLPSHFSPPPLTIDGRGAWVLDYAIRPGGSVVPQELWVPQGQVDRRRYMDQARFRMPVFFVGSDGSLGVPVLNAAAGQIQLRDANLPPQLHDKYTAKIRIAVRTFLNYVLRVPHHLPCGSIVAGLWYFRTTNST